MTFSKKANIEGAIEFLPVGQGTFSFGQLQRRPRHHVVPFTWVYDCGTSSGAANLRAHSTTFSMNLRGDLDVLFISHFDRDHTSGLVELLQSVRVRTVVLPYASLWQRLLIAATENSAPGEPLFELMLNPAGYLQRSSPQAISTFLFVPNGGETSEPGRPSAPPHGDNRMDDWETRYDTEDQLDEETLADLGSMSQSGSAKVSLLKRGTNIRVNSLWEFVPYNDALVEPPPSSFIGEIKRLAQNMTDAPTSRERSALLSDIRSCYDKQFGKSSTKRNVISMFLYAGYISGVTKDAWTWHDGWGSAERSNASFLYTGDGFLDNSVRLGNLERAIGRWRLNDLSGLQVMHHGSAKSWHAGVAAKLKPRSCVFCADPDFVHKHPDAEVVRDFLPFRPVLVNKGLPFRMGFAARV